MGGYREAASPTAALRRPGAPRESAALGAFPDALGVRLKQRPPPHQPHPLGRRRSRVEDRQAPGVLSSSLRPDGQGIAPQEMGLGPSRAIHHRVPEGAAADVFLVRKSSLEACEALQGIDWA
jgi:hypothetical protein